MVTLAHIKTSHANIPSVSSLIINGPCVFHKLPNWRVILDISIAVIDQDIRLSGMDCSTLDSLGSSGWDEWISLMMGMLYTWIDELAKWITNDIGNECTPTENEHFLVWLK